MYVLGDVIANDEHEGMTTMAATCGVELCTAWHAQIWSLFTKRKIEGNNVAHPRDSQLSGSAARHAYAKEVST